MIIIKIFTDELIRIFKSVKKGIDCKCDDELRGIRFKIANDELIAYTTNGRIVCTNRTTILDRDGDIEEGFEFVSPIITFPKETDDTVNITVDYDENKIEYDFGKSKQIMELYYMNLNFNNLEEWFNNAENFKSEIHFNVESLKKILNGFSNNDVVVFKVREENKMILVESELNSKNKRLINPVDRKKD